MPLRVMCPHAELLLGSVKSVDLEAQTAEVESEVGPQTVRWTQLVLALGAVPRTVPVPGLAEHGARSSRSRMRSTSATTSSSRSRRPTRSRIRPSSGARLSFVFVGAGYAGVEALAELSDLVDDVMRYYPGCAAFRAAGCSSTRPRRSCRRSRRGSATMPPAS